MIDIIEVKPALKNRIQIISYGDIAISYKNNYTANKIHSLESFKLLEKLFSSNISKSMTDKKKGHIADSVMQILGHIYYS